MSKAYDVVIQETFRQKLIVWADSPEEAVEKTYELANEGRIDPCSMQANGITFDRYADAIGELSDIGYESSLKMGYQEEG